jgi:hypothetical protein
MLFSRRCQLSGQFETGWQSKEFYIVGPEGNPTAIQPAGDWYAVANTFMMNRLTWPNMPANSTIEAIEPESSEDGAAI